MKHTSKSRTFAATLFAIGSLAGGANGATIIETFDGGNFTTANGTTVVWSTYGDAPWSGKSNNLLVGNYFQSGSIGDLQISYLQMIVDILPGGGLLSFDYATSTEISNDWLIVTVNGSLKVGRSGESGLISYGPVSLSEGTNTILFRFTKSAAISDYQDAVAIDNVQVTNADVIAVPEPSSALLFGLAALGLSARRRRQ